MNKLKAIICDLDGTLCNHSHRLHFVEEDKEWLWSNGWKPHLGIVDGNWQPDYESFYAAMDKDTVNEWCSTLLSQIAIPEWESSIEILFVTERPEKCREVTSRWLHSEFGTYLNMEKLFMRPDYLSQNAINEDMCDDARLIPDHRPSHEVKREIYESEIKDKYEVLFVLEDDDECARMYRELGLIVLVCI